jgi:puromycin-sensitive aminopeptidase
VTGTLASALEAVHTIFTTEDTETRYRAWVAKLLGPALADVGLSSRPSDADDTKALRATLVKALGATARDSRVIEAARALVSGELDKPGSVEPTLLNVAVTVAAIHGDSVLYDRYLSRSRAATEPEERYQYLYALTRFSDPALVRRTMDLVLSAEVRSQDVKLVIARMLANPDIQELSWRLVRDRWPEIQKKTGQFVGNTVIVGALASFCDTQTAGEVRTFFGKNRVPDAERTLQQSIEIVTSCARVAEEQRPKLAEWLKGR